MTRLATVALLAVIAHRIRQVRDEARAARYQAENPKRAVGHNITITGPFGTDPSYAAGVLTGLTEAARDTR